MASCAGPGTAPEPQPLLESPSLFVDRAVEAGLRLRHENGMRGEFYFPEIVGAGAAFLDFDNDGDLDLYLVQGGRLGRDQASEPAIPEPGLPEPAALGDRLLRNDSRHGVGATGALRFTDVTAASGIVATGYGMGVATGDIDNDGWVDLYVTNFGSNQLWHNRGLGPDGNVTFEDITDVAGVDEPRWSTSATFTDLDGDGWLDLFVANYVDFRLANHQQCSNEIGDRDYCGPLSYRPLSDRLWRNKGPGADGLVRFADLSADVGLLERPGAGLGVLVADVDGDGRDDLYVANDQAPNHLWMNDSKGETIRLREEAMIRGCAVDHLGRAQASMGVAACDIDRDGDQDLFMTHLLREVNTLYINDGAGMFVDRSAASGLGHAAIGATGFGVVFLDVENDGWLDVMSVNGEVRVIRELAAAGDPFPFGQRNQLFRNEAGQFVDVSEQVDAFDKHNVSRGAAVGDVDNDGDADVLITNAHGSPQLLINQRGHSAIWLGLRLIGEQGRDALGARVSLPQEKSRLFRTVRTDSSYLVASDPRVLFGLGRDQAPRQVTVEWPSGRQERFGPLATGRYHRLEEGAGDALPSALGAGQ